MVIIKQDIKIYSFKIVHYTLSEEEGGAVRMTNDYRDGPCAAVLLIIMKYRIIADKPTTCSAGPKTQSLNSKIMTKILM